MKNGTSKISIAFALFLVLAIALPLTEIPLANAHTPPWTIPTYAYLSVAPNPIGVDQTAFVVMWLDKVPPTAGGVGGDRWTNMKLTITKPDGTTETKGPFMSDATGGTFTAYTPTQIGTYTFNFSFPGQKLSLYHPVTGIPGPGGMFSGEAYVNDTYLGSSTVATLTVTNQSAPIPPTYPLPTSYWTRPIEGQNTAWSQLASHYLGGGTIVDKVQPNGPAPNTPHIMWAKPLQDGGVVGGNYQVPDVTYYPGLSYEGRFATPLIIYGRLYYDTPLGNDPNDGPYTCVDLRTGETLWTNDNISPTFGQLYLYESFNQHGVIGDGYLIQQIGGASFFGPPQPATWIFYDARTGRWLFNMTGVPGGFGASFLGGYGSGAVGSSGEAVIFTVSGSGANARLTMWNSSAAPNTGLVLTPGNSTDAFQYRPIGKSVNMSRAYTWNVSISGTLTPGSSIQRAIPDDILLLSTPLTGFTSFGTPDPVTVTAVSLKPNSRGTILWTKQIPAPPGNITRAFGPIDPETRVFTMTEKETMQWLGFDLDSGEQLWGPLGEFRDFQYFGTVSHPPAPGYAAYGKLYVGGYGGEIVAFDLRTGDEVWRYNNTFSGTETPWGYYPLFIAGIADNKIFAYTSEHSPNAPPYKGSRVRAIDATTGEELWTLLSWYAIGSFGEEAMPIADGYLSYLNIYDMRVYTIGKGPSKTTINAPQAFTSLGTQILITGSVTDQSEGAKQLVETGKFTTVPAMSDESMGPWMEYLYMQKPKPTNATGVQVKLTAFDPNGNAQDIGTATTDAFGNYAVAWTPPIEGTYYIQATFEGTESYYSSEAATYFGVGPAAATQPTPTPTPTQTATPTPTATGTPAPSPGTPFTTEVMLAIAAVVIIVVVLAAVALFRRRK